MAGTPDVVIAMPAFNEENAIEAFLAEICDAFDDVFFRLVVVNDCSTDTTEKVLKKLSDSYPLDVHTNQQNLGHGPSTLTALRLAAELHPTFVLATDGDGHITGETLRHLYDQASASPSGAVVEGARTQRDDPWFRKTVSAATRTLVKKYSGAAPLDANTPFRVYRVEVLQELLIKIPADHMTPNLMVSTFVRKGGVPFHEIPITPHKREGTQENGSTWKQRFRLLPSRRFLQFCVKAMAQWVSPGKAAQ